MALICKQIIKLTAKSPFFFNKKFIMTTPAKMEKVMEDLQKNPYFEKYAGKISQLQKTSPEEFLRRIEEKEEKEKQKKEKLKSADRQYSSVLNPKVPLEYSETKHDDKRLEDIMKIELIKDKNSEEIKQIWHQYHVTKDVIAATIPSKVFDLMCSRIKKYPVFLFPLPRSQGYEFVMCQFSGNTVHFTPLLCYQVHKENAPECLNITHYTELKDEKGIVLMRGEFDKNVIDAKEAQCLANELQLYYGQDSKSKLNLLEQFTNKPDEFKHMSLIEELETLSLK